MQIKALRYLQLFNWNYPKVWLEIKGIFLFEPEIAKTSIKISEMRQMTDCSDFHTYWKSHVPFSLSSSLNWYFFINKAYNKPNQKAETKHEIKIPSECLLHSVYCDLLPPHGTSSWTEHLLPQAVFCLIFIFCFALFLFTRHLLSQRPKLIRRFWKSDEVWGECEIGTCSCYSE